MVGMDTETRFSVKQLAEMAGVSARTLHYYDEIGLLRPARDPANGYRQYDRPAVLRLQQILFLRELGLECELHSADIDETPLPGETPAPLALRLATAKASGAFALAARGRNTWASSRWKSAAVGEGASRGGRRAFSITRAESFSACARAGQPLLPGRPGTLVCFTRSLPSENTS